MTDPNCGALTVLLVPFKKQRGRSSISSVACLLRERFPRIVWRLRKAASGQPLDVSGQWQLSVSHSSGYLAVSLSKLACGIDLEVLRHSHRWRDLYDWVTPPSARLREPTSADFLRAWTTKEALLKWQGLGLNGGLQRQPVPEQDWPGWQWLEIDDRRTFVRHERLRPGMSLALVCEQPLPVHWLDLSNHPPQYL